MEKRDKISGAEISFPLRLVYVSTESGRIALLNDMSDSSSVVGDIRDLIAPDDDGDLKRTALVTGSVALGALVTSSLFRKIRHQTLTVPLELRPAIDADTDVMECMEGSVRFYHRDGSGIPIVLLHSINAAASSYEMKPIFDYFADRTNRPIYALDWLGFGRSDRPPVRYSPGLYQRHLRRFLSEHVHQPADIVALSLACEYTAAVACDLPYLVHKVVLISPTGMSAQDSIPSWQRAIVATASGVGAFQIFFYRLTRKEMLRSFYERQVFASGDVPDEIVDYAGDSTLVYGAHHAPRFLVQGRLSSGPTVADTYAGLRVPALLIVPESDDGLIQHFDTVDEVASRNSETLRAKRLKAGLMPQWEGAENLFRVLQDFLISD